MSSSRSGEGKRGPATGLEALLERLSAFHFGRGLSVDNLETMRAFFYPPAAISATACRKSSPPPRSETLSRESIAELAGRERNRDQHLVPDLVRLRKEE